MSSLGRSCLDQLWHCQTCQWLSMSLLSSKTVISSNYISWMVPFDWADFFAKIRLLPAGLFDLVLIVRIWQTHILLSQDSTSAETSPSVFDIYTLNSPHLKLSLSWEVDEAMSYCQVAWVFILINWAPQVCLEWSEMKEGIIYSVNSWKRSQRCTGSDWENIVPDESRMTRDQVIHLLSFNNFSLVMEQWNTYLTSAELNQSKLLPSA